MHPNSESGAAVQVRLTGSEFVSLENWRRAQSKIPPRSEAIREAIRRLVRQQALGATEQRASAAADRSRTCSGQIAAVVQADDKTVGATRKKLEATR